MRKTIANVFHNLRERRRIGLLPFLAAGFPDTATTTETIIALEAAGASAIEIGFPFSDPIADGPTIQEAFTFALSRGLKVADVFAAVATARPRISIPLLAMVSYSIVYRYGLERFVSTAKSSGFDALIIPDLPPPEAQRVCGIVQAGGLDTVLLVAPTTTVERRREIARLCSGFIYYLSLSGVTGERENLPSDLSDGVRQLKGLTDKPICVGFGISKPQHLSQLQGLADGAIVGSAFVKIVKANLGRDPKGLAELSAAYARELLSSVSSTKSG
jgi:tryptophan synthase alpha chain